MPKEDEPNFDQRVHLNGLLAIDLSAVLVKKLDRIRKLAYSGLYHNSSVGDKDAVLMDIVKIVDEKLNN